jgi:hypothetical protein
MNLCFEASLIVSLGGVRRRAVCAERLFPAYARTNQGTVKFVVTLCGVLLLAPYSVNEVELSHAVLSGGQPVLAGGKAEIVARAASDTTASRSRAQPLVPERLTRTATTSNRDDSTQYESYQLRIGGREIVV